MIASEAVAPGIFRLTSHQPPPAGWPRPFFYLVGDRELVLIDTGYPDRESVADLKAFLSRHSGTLQRVVLTHGHIDHAGDLKEIKSHFHPKVAAHKLEKEILRRSGADIEIDEWVSDGDNITSELGPLVVRHTPGHCPGHLCLELSREHILFTGDLIVGEGTSFVGPPDGDMAQYMNSLERMKQVHARIMLPGHGAVINDPERHLANLIEHRLLREVQVLKLLQASGPSTPAQLAAKIYRGLIHPGLYKVAEITVLGHLNKLEKEGKVAPEMEANGKHWRLNVALPF